MATQYRNAIGPTINVTNVGNAAISGGGQGAMAGSAFGPWGAIIGAIVGTVGGILTGGQQRRAQEAAIAAQLEAASKANDANLTALANALSDISKQRAVSFMETQSALLYTKVQGESEIAKNINAINSADQIGSVVDVVKSSIIGDIEASKWQTMFNAELLNDNLNTNVLQQITAGTNAFMGVNIGSTGGFNPVQALTGGLQMATAYNEGKTNTMKRTPAVGGKPATATSIKLGLK